MRFLGLVRTAEGQGAPPQAMADAMQQFIKESLANGSLVETGGLAPAAQTVRIRHSRGQLHRVDGPFAESKEVVGGYAILEAPSREAAIETMNKFMQLHQTYWPEWEGESDLREMVFVAGR
jgi:hypothetical protein